MKMLATIAIVAAALVGCDRTHMSPNFGVANRNAFRAQIIDPHAGTQVKAAQPLDPEEAAVVARTYRRSLAPASQQQGMGAAGGQMLVVPSGGATAPAAPPGGYQP